MGASDLAKLGLLILCGIATSLPLAAFAAQAALGGVVSPPAAPPAANGLGLGFTPAAKPPPPPFSTGTLKLLWGGAVGSGVVALAANRAPAGALGPLAWLPFASRYVHLLSTTLAAFAAGAVLVPKKLQKVLHPLVSCTGTTLGAITLLAAACGLPWKATLRGYLLPGLGPLAAPGNLLLAMLGPATFSFGFMIFSRRALVRANAAAVSACIGASSVVGLLGTAAFAKALQLPAAVRLASVSRQVTAPLAIAIAGLLGADPSLAATIVVLTGLVVANFGAAALDALGVRAPVARGLAMGAAGHGLGTAATSGESDAFPFAAIAMALNAALSTVLVSLPAFRRVLRAAAGVP
jgi:putative effector of murein hydrolase